MHNITRMPEYNTYVITLHEGWDTPEEINARTADIQRILQEAEEPVRFIMDASRIPITIEGLILSANQVARGPNAPFHHLMCKEIALVMPERIAQFITRGLQTATFGNLNVSVYPTIEQALEKGRAS